MCCFLLLLSFVSLCVSTYASFGVSYDGYQVLEVTTPSNQTELDNIMDEYNSSVSGITHTEKVQLLLGPTVVTAFEADLASSEIEYKVLISNLQSLIEEQMENDVSNHTMKFDKYNTYQVIKEFLEGLGKNQGNNMVRCKTEVIGTTAENNPICVIKIYKLQKPQHCHRRKKKPAILIDGGIHAREWISPAFLLYLINQLKNNPDKSQVIDHVLDKFDWYLIPVLNPDGYIFTHLRDRLWRKNRRVTQQKPKCFGVDLNRNFGHMWDPFNGGSNDACNYQVYAGPHAFSEAESIALKDVMLRKNNYCAYLTFHSFGQYWLYPWGYTKLFSNDVTDLQNYAVMATNALTTVYGTQYKVGSAANVLHSAAGGSDDYAKAVAKIKYSYTIELRDKGDTFFILPANQIIPTCEETIKGVLTFALKLIETKRV